MQGLIISDGDNMIDELVIEMMKNNMIIPVCSVEDCRKVRLNNTWYQVEYKPNYKLYSHSICPECKTELYGVQQ